MKEQQETEQNKIKNYWGECFDGDDEPYKTELCFPTINDYCEFINDYNLSHHKAEKLDNFIDALLDYLIQYKMQFIYREQMDIIQNIIDKVKELGGVDNE